MLEKLTQLNKSICLSIIEMNIPGPYIRIRYKKTIFLFLNKTYLVGKHETLPSMQI